jgi:hypothetical protein
MLRHDRVRFALLGLPFLLNIPALALFALNAATSGHGHCAGDLSLILIGACLLLSIPFVIKRGRDLGQPAKGTIAFWLLGYAVPPLWLGLLGVYSFKKASPKADALGPAPGPLGIGILPLAVLAYAWPWMLMAIWCRI